MNMKCFSNVNHIKQRLQIKTSPNENFPSVFSFLFRPVKKALSSIKTLKMDWSIRLRKTNRDTKII